MSDSCFIAMLERIENETAVLELEKNHKQFLLPVSLLPAGIQEGIVLEFTVTPRPDLTSARKSKVADLQKKLSERSG